MHAPARDALRGAEDAAGAEWTLLLVMIASAIQCALCRKRFQTVKDRFN